MEDKPTYNADNRTATEKVFDIANEKLEQALPAHSIDVILVKSQAGDNKIAALAVADEDVRCYRMDTHCLIAAYDVLLTKQALRIESLNRIIRHDIMALLEYDAQVEDLKRKLRK